MEDTVTTSWRCLEDRTLTLLVYYTVQLGRWRIYVITVQMCERVELSESFEILY